MRCNRAVTQNKAAEGSGKLERTVGRVEGAGPEGLSVYSLDAHGEAPEWEGVSSKLET